MPIIIAILTAITIIIIEIIKINSRKKILKIKKIPENILININAYDGNNNTNANSHNIPRKAN